MCGLRTHSVRPQQRVSGVSKKLGEQLERREQNREQSPILIFFFGIFFKKLRFKNFENTNNNENNRNTINNRNNRNHISKR